MSRRYQADQVVFVGYHGGSNIPLAKLADSLWDRTYAWYPYPIDTLIKLSFGRQTLGAVIGKASLVRPNGDTIRGYDGSWTFVNGRRIPEAPGGAPILAYEGILRIEQALRSPPAAFVQLELERNGDSVEAKVTVDSIVGANRRLVVRMVLFEDSVRVRGATNRRVHLNVTRAVAAKDDLTLGLPIPGDQPSTTGQRFDLGKIRTDLLAGRDPEFQIKVFYTEEQRQDPAYEFSKKMLRDGVGHYPAFLDWQIDEDHLYLLAFVQDLTTGEVLQGVVLKLPPSGGRARKSA